MMDVERRGIDPVPQKDSTQDKRSMPIGTGRSISTNAIIDSATVEPKNRILVKETVGADDNSALPTDGVNYQKQAKPILRRDTSDEINSSCLTKTKPVGRKLTWSPDVEVLTFDKLCPVSSIERKNSNRVNFHQKGAQAADERERERFRPKKYGSVKRAASDQLTDHLLSSINHEV